MQRPALVTLFALPAPTAGVAIAAGASTEVAAPKQAACDAGHAHASRDIDALDRLTAEDYSPTDARGTVLKRAEWLEFVGKRTSTLTVECDGVRVSLYHRTAVVTGGWTPTNHKPTATSSRARASSPSGRRSAPRANATRSRTST